MVILAIVACLGLLPPVTGAAIIIFARRYPPRLRSTLGLGVTVLLSAALFGLAGAVAALLEGRQPIFPYLVVTSLPAVTVWRAMQVEGAYVAERDNIPNPFAIKFGINCFGINKQ